MLDGVVNESIITGYSVFMADNCSRKVGDALAFVEKLAQEPSSCCQQDAYEVEFAAQLPLNVSSVAVMIVPMTVVGALSVGVMTDFIQDYVSDEPWGVGRLSAASPLNVLAGATLAIIATAWLQPILHDPAG